MGSMKMCVTGWSLLLLLLFYLLLSLCFLLFQPPSKGDAFQWRALIKLKHLHMFGCATLKLRIRRDTLVCRVKGKRGEEKKRMTYLLQNVTASYDSKFALNSIKLRKSFLGVNLLQKLMRGLTCVSGLDVGYKGKGSHKNSIL